MTKRETVASLRAQLARLCEERDRCIAKAREVEETLGRVERNVEALRAEHEQLREELAYERRARRIQYAHSKAYRDAMARLLDEEISAHVHAVVTGSKDQASLDEVVSLKVEVEREK